jgi:hypothetical protein
MMMNKDREMSKRRNEGVQKSVGGKRGADKVF